MSNYFKSYKKILPTLVLASICILAFSGLVLAGKGGSTGNELITNPLKSIDSIPELINAVLKIVVKVGVPLVALAIIYVGFLFVKAQGNENELKTAKEAFLYTIIGAGIVLGAFVISQAIQATVTSLGT
ncbi:MAG: hypothetical protein UY81_C0074G0012 [Candidatus Giovannonibacteria bacterium GW2011_GWA2_53_7]|uniref:TrbC/VIRB2 family protein n=1 Tax=Candidatus Giovannonibacteria bacterium GW2011_GWA2_53_7 TaxID=1618650 RepID=A0A0G2A101_9BACT|nr:MAG: hypothetical protein UY81_C0074G0012 [Candidatus Giovannonibacteria bacterium GW2011_GWA2_53_7]